MTADRWLSETLYLNTAFVADVRLDPFVSTQVLLQQSLSQVGLQLRPFSKIKITFKRAFNFFNAWHRMSEAFIGLRMIIEKYHLWELWSVTSSLRTMIGQIIQIKQDVNYDFTNLRLILWINWSSHKAIFQFHFSPWFHLPYCIYCTWRAWAACSCAATCGFPGCAWRQTSSCRSRRWSSSGPGGPPWSNKANVIK